MKKTYINPELEVVMLSITHPLMAGSLTIEGAGLDELVNGGPSGGGKVADSHEFDSFFNDEEEDFFE